MNRDSLVLNKSFLAIHVINWEKTMSLLFQGAAEALDDNLQGYSFEDWVELSKAMEDNPKGFICSANMKVAVPEVIRLTKYDALPRQEVKFTRKNIYEHYHNTCCYCGKHKSTKELNLDHVLPKSRGGHTCWTNIVLACISCNTKKDNRTPEEAHMPLLVKPSRPKWQRVQTISMHAPAPIPVSWQRLLDEKYWSSELKP